ncbi:MAG: DM13 domain-containing protein [Pseudomonadota bacterium]
MLHLLRTTLAALGLMMLALVPLSAEASETIVGQGSFTGASDHVTSGKVTVISTPEGNFVVLGDDFFLDGAPDPHVALGKAGSYDADTRAGLLQSNSGPGRYKLPDHIDPADFDEVYIWCVRFNVPLGVAQLN